MLKLNGSIKRVEIPSSRYFNLNYGNTDDVSNWQPLSKWCVNICHVCRVSLTSFFLPAVRKRVIFNTYFVRRGIVFADRVFSKIEELNLVNIKVELVVFIFGDYFLGLF